MLNNTKLFYESWYKSSAFQNTEVSSLDLKYHSFFFGRGNIKVQISSSNVRTGNGPGGPRSPSASPPFRFVVVAKR